MRTFAVSEVERAGSPLPGIDARAAIEALARGAVEAWWTPGWPLARAFEARPDMDASGAWVTQEVALHPFFAAVHAAFDQHRPLELSPDAVWLCIAQGFATHVQQNAERLRSKMVAHQGRETIEVRRDDFVPGSAQNAWPEVFAAFSERVGARTGELRDIVVCDFTTTDAASRAASEIALLSAAQPFFAYQVRSMCGIPAITLTGTPDDWRAVRARAARLASYELGWWTSALDPILEHFVRAAEGDVDVAHWSTLYKQNNGSGGPYISGWINVLLPYLQCHQGTVPNPYVESWSRGMGAPFGGGPTTEQLPSGLSRVPFLWKHLDRELRMELLGGFAGVGQDPSTGRVRPEIGWAVRRAE
jgi:hypothetical protein